MFAFAGASTFPTIQADMADRSKFNISAIIAMAILFLIYFPMAVGGYYSLGNEVDISPYYGPNMLSCPQGDGQHCLGDARGVDEDVGGDHAAAPPHHRLPHHHQPPCSVL